MANSLRRARWLAITALIYILFGCTERIDLAPVHVGHQDIHALLPDYSYPPPVTQGHVAAGSNAQMLAPPLPSTAKATNPAHHETPPPSPPALKPSAPNTARIKPNTTIASNIAAKKSIMPQLAPEKPIPKTSPAPSKPTSPSANKAKLNFAWPLAGRIMKNYHQTGKKGIKIAAGKEHTVRAAEAGQVVYCGQGLIGYGNLLIIKHNSQYLTAYANNSALLAKEGDTVEKGQRIATVGAGPAGKSLLHFEIRKHGKAVNPLALLPKL